jgi:hypothetical protein
VSHAGRRELQFVQEVFECPTCYLVVEIRQGVSGGSMSTIYRVTKQDHDLECPPRRRPAEPVIRIYGGQVEQLALELAA